MKILAVEDNSTDSKLLQRAFREVYPDGELTIAEDGVQAIGKLNVPGQYLPDVIILDLNLPIKDGLEILIEIRQKQQLKSIPIIVLSTSRLRADMETSRLLNASEYWVKPEDYKSLVEHMKSLKKYGTSAAVI